MPVPVCDADVCNALFDPLLKQTTVEPSTSRSRAAAQKVTEVLTPIGSTTEARFYMLARSHVVYSPHTLIQSS